MLCDVTSSLGGKGRGTDTLRLRLRPGRVDTRTPEGEMFRSIINKV